MASLISVLINMLIIPPQINIALVKSEFSNTWYTVSKITGVVFKIYSKETLGYWNGKSFIFSLLGPIQRMKDLNSEHRVVSLPRCVPELKYIDQYEVVSLPQCVPELKYIDQYEVVSLPHSELNHDEYHFFGLPQCVSESDVSELDNNEN
jgi:hypothetical protein